MEKTILNERYELMELIGTGGMGHVYRAKDNKLDRLVAVKILKEEFLDDEEFVGRFHAEAQAAAKLSHSNIVAVFDVGVDRDMHFIVMELIEGVILSDYVKKQGMLDSAQALTIAMQIAKALVHAHKNGIVHRDIKPHNVLLAKDGTAKVADFGIAKAASARTFTLSGKTVGSVHYFSPEQARGGYVDARTDIYSLGVVMYEMLTGSPPFDGETPVVVAVKHLQQKLKAPKEINPDIPDDVNTIVTKAMEKSADDRYQAASELVKELDAAIAGRELPSSFDINMDFVEGTENAFDEMDSTKNFTPVSGSRALGEEYDVPLTKYRKRHTMATVLAVLSAVALVVILAYYGVTEMLTTVIPEPEEYILGDYRGMEYEEVKEKLEDEFKIIVEKHGVYSDEVPEGIIMEQDKEQGIVFKELTANKIRFTVSLGLEEIVIPPLKGLEYRIAERDLKDLELDPIEIEIENENIAKGQVIRTDPAEGMVANPGQTVSVYVSLGPELKAVTIPDFKGLTLDEAKEMLSDYNLKLGGYVPNDITENSVIVEQVPAAGAGGREGDRLEFRLSVPVNRVLVQYPYMPGNLERQSEPIKVVVEATPSHTDITDIVYSQSHLKEHFPILIPVEIPENGSTYIKVLLNNVVDTETILYYDDFADNPGTQVIEPATGGSDTE